VAQGDNSISLFDVSSGAPQHVGRIVDFGTLPTAIGFSPSGKRLALGPDTGSVSIYDVSDPSHPLVSATYPGPYSSVFAVAFTPDEKWLIAGAGDEIVWAWDVASKGSAPVLSLPAGMGRVYDVRVIQGGARIAATSPDGVVRTFVIDQARAHSELCKSRGEPLSAAEWTRYLPGVTPFDPCG
jgi:WD40 repeat protein